MVTKHNKTHFLSKITSIIIITIIKEIIDKTLNEKPKNLDVSFGLHLPGVMVGGWREGS